MQQRCSTILRCSDRISAYEFLVRSRHRRTRDRRRPGLSANASSACRRLRTTARSSAFRKRARSSAWPSSVRTKRRSIRDAVSIRHRSCRKTAAYCTDSFARQRSPQLEQYYKALLRTCAGTVTPGAPREPFCKSIERLSNAGDIDAYFVARTAIPSSPPRAGAGVGRRRIRRWSLRSPRRLRPRSDRQSRRTGRPVQRSIAFAQLLLQRLEPKLH